MKKDYQKPMLISEEFIPNEYVAGNMVIFANSGAGKSVTMKTLVSLSLIHILFYKNI